MKQYYIKLDTVHEAPKKKSTLSQWKEWASLGLSQRERQSRREALERVAEPSKAKYRTEALERVAKLNRANK